MSELEMSNVTDDGVAIKTTKENSRKSKKSRSQRRKGGQRSKEYIKKKEAKTRSLDKNERYNNPNWYFLSQEVKEQCSQLAFQDILGISTPLNEEIPNFMRIFVNPGPGVASPLSSVKSGFNQSMFVFYSQLAAFTGRTQQYAPQDVGVVILALGELVSIAEFIRRVFGITAMSNERNFSYPKYAAEAMTINAADLQMNRANYRDRFNFLLTRINALPIPGDCAYIMKCLEIYQNVFLDDPSPLATSMMFLPSTTWVLNDSWYEEGTILETVSCCQDYSVQSQSPVVRRELSYYLDLLERQIDNLQNSQVWAVIYSDILNYASKHSYNQLKLDMLSDNYGVLPSYNIEALMQIKHLSVMTSGNMYTVRPTEKPEGGLRVTPYNDVFPDVDSNSIVYNPVFHPDVDSTQHNLMLSVPVPNPSADMVLEATRFAATYGVNITDGDTIIGNALCSLPDHWVTFVDIIGNGDNVLEEISSNTVTEAEVTAGYVRALSKVSCAPFLYIIDSSNKPAGVIGDLAYFTEVPQEWIDKLILNVTMGLYLIRTGK